MLFLTQKTCDWFHFSLFPCSHKKKRAKQVKKLLQRGELDPERADPLSLFLETTPITHCLYKHSERILGNTFGMCILQVLLEILNCYSNY